MYKYKNYPAICTTEDKLWCITGKCIASGHEGVLEWFPNKNEAVKAFWEMALSREFQNLDCRPWQIDPFAWLQIFWLNFKNHFRNIIR